MPESWKLKLLHDGLCPMCALEINWLRRRNKDGALAFEDIAAADFDPSVYGLTIDQLVGSMHAQRADGTIFRGPDVFIEAYRLVGLRWLAAVVGFRPIRPLVNLGYKIFAAVRPRFSKFDPAKCEGGRCKLPV